jgi:hypothetical protein
LTRITCALLSLAAFSLPLVAQTTTSACSAISLGDMGPLNGWVPSSGDAWHQDVSNLPVDPSSATIIGTAGDLGYRYLHPDFSNVADGSYGIPYTVVDTSTQSVPMVSISPYDSFDSDNTLFPLPNNVAIEGTPGQCWNDSADHHAIVIDRATCADYEIYQADLCNGSWTSYGNVIWDFSLPNGEQRPYGMSSVDAAGLSVFEGLIRYDEITAGAINHAIRFTAEHTKNDDANGYFTAPAVHAAGNLWGTDNIMGMRIRLKASYDISGFSPTNQIILTAMKKYGMILADNGSDMFFQGAPDPNWDDNDLGALKGVPSSAFEVVQMNPVYDAYDAPVGPAPTITSFTASADNVAPGTSVTLTPDVSGSSYEFIDLTGYTRGPVTVAPTCTTTYTLWSRNQYNTSTQSVTVNVAGGSSSCAASSGSGGTGSSGSGSSGISGGSGSSGGSSSSGGPNQNSGLSIDPVNAAVGLPTTLSVTTASTGAVTYYVLSGPATVTGNTLTPTGIGSVMLQASQAADPTYLAATAITTFNVAANGTTLAFTPVPNQTYGATPFTISAASNSPAAITYTVASGPATISGSTVSLIGSGTVTLKATQLAYGTYTGATALTSFAVSGIAPTLSVDPIPTQTFGALSFPVTASSNSVAPITFSVLSGPATIMGNYVTLTGTGTVTLQASQAVSQNYSAGTAVGSFSVLTATPTLGFNPMSTPVYGQPPFPVAVTSNSTGAITYSVISGPATVSGNMVTVTGAGVVAMQADQVAAGNYRSGTTTTYFTVYPATTNLAFAQIANQTYGASPFAVSATSNSTGVITYSVVSGPAAVSGNIVSVTGTGTVVLQASQAAAGAYSAATASTSFTVSSTTTSLAFAAIGSKIYGASPFAVSATSNSPGAITYAVVSGPATLSGNTVTLTGSGAVVLQANQAAASPYSASSVTTSFNVAPATPALVFAPVANQTFGAAPFAVSATSNSNGAITYVVQNGPATISGDVVSLTGSGTVTLAASQAASAPYAAATVSTSFTISGAGSGLAFVPIANQTYGAAPFTVSATSSSSSAITFSVLSGPATISANRITLTGTGTVTVQASQAAAGSYLASSVSTSFGVSAAPATLTFAPVANQIYGAAPFAISASSNSSGAITYSVVGGPATVSGNTVTLSGAGSVTLQATQAASGSYAAATANTTFTVSAETPALAFSSIGNQTYGSAPFAISASSKSSGAITYTVVSGPATVSGNLVTLTGSGTVVLQASQAASGSYASTSASTTFTIAPATTTLTFAPIANQTYGAAPFTISATSNSSGAITYSVEAGPATLSGNTLTLTGAGTVVLEASQAASGAYAAATATTSFTVATVTTGLSFVPVANQTYGAEPFSIAATSNSNGAITFSTVSGPATVSGHTVTLTGTGTVVLQAVQAVAGGYSGATATTSFTVSAASSVLAFTPIPNQTYSGTILTSFGTGSGSNTLVVSATSNSPAKITYSVVSGAAVVSGNMLTLTGAGTVTVEADQDATAGFAPASTRTSFNVAQATPVLVLPSIGPQTFGSGAVVLAASSNSPGAITYTVVSGPAVLSGNTLTLTGAGTVVLQATQAATSNFLGVAATTSFPVAADVTGLTLGNIPTQTFGSGPLTLSATSNSPAPITFSVIAGAAAVTGNSLALNGTGNVTVQATQPAYGAYPAATATTSFTISPSSVLLAGDFTLPNNRTITIMQGASGTVTVPVTSVNGFAGVVNFQCAVPANFVAATCNTTNAQLTTTSATTANITIATRSAVLTAHSAPPASNGGRGLAALALLLPCGLPFLRRRKLNLRSLTLGIALALSMAAATLGTTGCGSEILGGFSQAGTYVLNVNATGGSNVHAMTVTVIVQAANGPVQ